MIDNERTIGSFQTKKMNIELVHFSRNVDTYDEVQHFKMLYWASFLGELEIVEHIIRLGFSPFMPAHDSKNALFAAVDGN